MHQIRGRVDAIIVGIGTAEADNPKLTARPAGVRAPARIVLDSSARISIDSNLVSTSNEIRTMIVVSSSAGEKKCRQLQDEGCEIVRLGSNDYIERWEELLIHLGQLEMTNVLVEGGSQVLGALQDGNMIDEVHCFIAPKIVGGSPGYSPVTGTGVSLMEEALQLQSVEIETLGDNVYFHGRIKS